MGQNALSYLGFYFDTAASKCIPASSNVSSNQVPNSFFLVAWVHIKIIRIAVL